MSQLVMLTRSWKICTAVLGVLERVVDVPRYADLSESSQTHGGFHAASAYWMEGYASVSESRLHW